MIPKIIKEGETFLVEGNYEFTKSEQLIFDSVNDISFMSISFNHSPELPADVSQEDVIELLAERLKQDFIKFNQNK